MQSKTLSLTLTEAEWSTLCKAAGLQLRNPKQHARFLLRRALGLLANDGDAQEHSSPQSQQQQQEVAA